MKIMIQTGKNTAVQADALAVFISTDQLETVEKRYETSLPQAYKTIKKAQEFEAKEGQILAVPVQNERADFLFFVGLGEAKKLQASTIHKAFATSIQKSNALGLARLVFAEFSQSVVGARELGTLLGDVVEYVDYRFELYKKEKGGRTQEVILEVSEGIDSAEVEAGVVEAQKIQTGVSLARDLVNTPGQDMKPMDLAETAKKIAAESEGRIEVQVYDRAWAKEQGMGAYLAVAQGSKDEPAFIHLTYKPAQVAEGSDVIAFVGKGVTFDSGGLSLKPSAFMETMKADMAGSAAVLGAFEVLKHGGVDTEVHGVIAATENMPSDSAIRPGDVVKAANGKTIEILNTDAEGRLTLADAIHFAGEQGATKIIDLATLTGACVVALGEEIAALMSPEEDFSEEILAAAKATGEKLWPLPLEARYQELLKSDIADLRNISTSRYGGAITAGLFLQSFVKDGVKWAHVDIAGPAFAEKPIMPYISRGATGYGVRLLISLLTSN